MSFTSILGLDQQSVHAVIVSDKARGERSAIRDSDRLLEHPLSRIVWPCGAGAECTAPFFLPARIPVKLTKVGCRLRTWVPWAGRVFTPTVHDLRPRTAWAASGLDRGRPAFGTDREASVER